MIDKVIFYSGPPKGLYEYKNFREFMLGLIDVGRAETVSLSNNEDENGLEGVIKDQTYHVHPGVTLSWDSRFCPGQSSNDRHCMVSLYGKEESIIEVMELLQEMERVHQYLRAIDVKNLRNM